jgi:hypothetical protein
VKRIVDELTEQALLLTYVIIHFYLNLEKAMEKGVDPDHLPGQKGHPMTFW